MLTNAYRWSGQNLPRKEKKEYKKMLMRIIQKLPVFPPEITWPDIDENGFKFDGAVQYMNVGFTMPKSAMNSLMIETAT